MKLTFDGVQKVLDAVFVEAQRFGIVFVLILFSGFGHQIDGLLQSAARRHCVVGILEEPPKEYRI